MRILGRNAVWPMALATIAFLACGDDTNPVDPEGAIPGSVAQAGGKGGGGGGGGGGGKPVPGESAGNNLSFPVIWAEGATKTLRGSAGMIPSIDGEWWYWWGTSGTDPNIVPLSCAPDPDDESFCDDGKDGSTGAAPGVGFADVYKAYIQKDVGNEWQAEIADWQGRRVEVSWLDWGDNLESNDWYTRSQVRTEVVLIQDLQQTMTAYEMLHTDGWGINEVHGLAELNGVVKEFDSNQATVYSTCARLTIQRLLVDRDDPSLVNLVWNPSAGWTGPGLVNTPIFNDAIWTVADGPGYYNAEVNVKGKIIYGYTWNVRQLNDGAGYYRITFSLDDPCGGVDLNTFFSAANGTAVTQIVEPEEEEEALFVAAADEGGDSGGATGVMDYLNNLTYIDVHILDRGSGGGGGGGGGKAGGKKK